MMGGVLAAVAAALAGGLLGGGTMIALVATMAVSELMLVRSIVVLGQLYQALDRVEVTSALNIGTASCRVVAVLSMMVLGIRDPLSWALTSCALTLVLVLLAHVVAARAMGAPRFDLARLWADRT